MDQDFNINKEGIRHQKDEISGMTYYSIVDSVGFAIKTSDPRNYWKVLKNRLKKAQNQLVTNCNQLKMKSADGKSYFTDVADSQTILEIVKIIDESKVREFERFFDNIGEKLQNKISPTSGFELKNDTENFSDKSSYPHDNFVEEKISVSDDADYELLVDTYVRNNFFVIEAFTAGVSLREISITMHKSNLTISGTRMSDIENKFNGLEPITSELAWGRFARTIAFPFEVKIDEAEARENLGTLSIKIPIAHRLTPKKILKMRTI